MSHATKKSSSGNSKTKATKPTKAQAAVKPTDPDLVPLTAMDKERKAGKGSAKSKATKEPKAVKEAAAAREPKAAKVNEGMSCLDAAAAVLKAKGEPMRCKDLINEMFAKKLWHSDAPTPAATLYSAILREMGRKGAKARFRKTDRGHFALNANA
jgi:hypothetical protein